MTIRPPIPTGLAASIYRADWRADAACRDWPTGMFFPERGSDSRSNEHSASIARAVCALCPVRQPCLMVALGFETRSESGLPRPSQLAGVWGGTTEKERRALRRQIAAGRPLAEVVSEVPAPSSARHPSNTSERASA